MNYKIYRNNCVNKLEKQSQHESIIESKATLIKSTKLHRVSLFSL
jgi:hypothetical protein